ncbi:MAG: lytic murein transglycosylase [Pseudobdellovibrionaceae bacterium]|nr:lytic murein transglycosylase [Pseudobdellovibrionaceae bacterium]
MPKNSRTFFKLGLGGLLLIIGMSSFATLTKAADVCTTEVVGKTREQLALDLEACNREIEKWTSTLSATKNESASFSRDVSALTAKINAAQANIKGKNIAIANLGKDIQDKESAIQNLDTQIGRGKAALAVLLRKTNEIDSFSLAEAMLSSKDFSDFFIDVDAYSATQRSLGNVFNELRGTKALTESERLALAQKRDAEASAKSLIESTKKEVERNQADKKTLLAASQSKEKTYAQVLAEKKAAAAKIREALFPLRDAGAIQFGTALQYANAASAATGVRPAFILAILQQESNLGANVGSCVITDLTTGATKNVNTGTIWPNGIHPTRDLPLLQTILTNLGRDLLTTKVSCPLSIGYGGAMGPTQFIPSTWVGIGPRVASILGKATADPWSPQDAITATAVFTKDLGAAAQTYEAERNAACRYYSGRACALGPGSAYGNQVMSRASTIQTTMIDPLSF